MNDMISRQAAIDALKEHRKLFCDNTPDTFSKLSYPEKCRVDELDTAIATLVNLPSAQPEQKVGKWIGGDIGYCTCCGHKGCASDIWNACEEMYCPNCGAKMEE